MATRIVARFRQLDPAAQDQLLNDLYQYSKELKLVLAGKLGLQPDFVSLVSAMERATIGKVYRKGIPGDLDHRQVVSIIRQAEAAGAPLAIRLQLEQLAYRGFIEFLNEFGGGPDEYDDYACEHLEAYLVLVRDRIDDPAEQQRCFAAVKAYLRKLNNMVTDYVDDIFDEVVGESVDR